MALSDLMIQFLVYAGLVHHDDVYFVLDVVLQDGLCIGEVLDLLVELLHLLLEGKTHAHQLGAFPGLVFRHFTALNEFGVGTHFIVHMEEKWVYFAFRLVIVGLCSGGVSLATRHSLMLCIAIVSIALAPIKTLCFIRLLLGLESHTFLLLLKTPPRRLSHDSSNQILPTVTVFVPLCVQKQYICPVQFGNFLQLFYQGHVFELTGVPDSASSLWLLEFRG